MMRTWPTIRSGHLINYLIHRILRPSAQPIINYILLEDKNGIGEFLPLNKRQTPSKGLLGFAGPRKLWLRRIARKKNRTGMREDREIAGRSIESF